jgi:probable HAF family extracellular repeat protein
MKSIVSLISRLLSVTAAVGIVAVTSSSQAQSIGKYNITDLGYSLGTNSHAHAINQAGHVVGYWDSVTNGIHAFLFTNGVTADLGTLGGTNTYALNINAGGQVVGFFATNNAIRAFLFDGAVTNLGGLGGENSYAFGINANGNIVGYVDTTNGARAFYLNAGTVTDLGTLGGTNSYAYGINSSNHVAGSALVSGNAAINAFLWAGGSLSNLNDLIPGGSGWTLQEARGINDGGQIVGWGVTNGQERAFSYANGTFTDLGILAGGTNSYALGINNSNHVVGVSTVSDGVEQAFLWSNGVLTNLNNLIRADLGWDLRESRGINDVGQIVGWGLTNGQEHAYLLTPNLPPTVSITEPTNSSTVYSPTSLVIIATASDDSMVSKVEFFEGSNKIGEDTSAPYSFTWGSVVAGSYSLTARATDDLGYVSTSSVVSVSVVLPATNNLKLWLKADTIAGLNDGDSIATWSDQSGNGNNATQATSGNRPAYRTSVINSKPAVRFDGTNDYFDLPNLLNGATQAEVFVIVKATADIPSGSRGLWRFGNSGSSSLTYPNPDIS